MLLKKLDFSMNFWTTILKTLNIICIPAGFEPRTFNWPAESDLQSSIWPLWWHQWHRRLTFLIGSAKNARKQKWPAVTFSEKLKKISNFKTSFFQQLRSTVWNARTRNVWRYGKTVTDFFWCRDFCSNKIFFFLIFPLGFGTTSELGQLPPWWMS